MSLLLLYCQCDAVDDVCCREAFEHVIPFFLPLVAGNFLYVGGTLLVPILNKNNASAGRMCVANPCRCCCCCVCMLMVYCRLWQFVALIAGYGIMGALIVVEPSPPSQAT